MADEARQRKRLARAEEDVRAAYRIAHVLTQGTSATPEVWRQPGGEGLTRAEVLLHLAKTGARICESLRLVASQGALTRPVERSPSQSVALRLFMTTWRVPEGFEAIADAEANGVVAEPSVVRDLHAQWTASYIALLRENTAEFLCAVRALHPRFGDLDPFEWARLIRIYFRHHELRLGIR